MQEPDIAVLLSWALKPLYDFHMQLDKSAFGLDVREMYVLSGKTPRLRVQKLYGHLQRTMHQMSQVGDHAMGNDIPDRLALAACKCEEVNRELMIACETLKPLLGIDYKVGAGNVSEVIQVPPVTFTSYLLNQIAILAGPNARLKEETEGEEEDD